MYQTKTEKASDPTIIVDQNYFRHNGANLLYSPSAKCFTKDLNHTWLLELIGHYQSEPKLKNTPFQLWELRIREDKSATLAVKDDVPSLPIIEEKIPYTTYPVDEMDFVFTGNILMDPLEYSLDYVPETNVEKNGK